MTIDWPSLTIGVLLGWIVGTIASAFAVGLFAINRPMPPTPWETSVMDNDVEVRWNNGRVESRLKSKL